jgi:outer membrane protein assembly factor BamD (BamD/ComL family)
MKPMRKLLAIATLLAAAAAPLSAQDIIRFKEGAKNQDMEGSIATMSYKLVEIEINIGGTLAKQPADARQIADLIPSNSNKTFDFAQGESAMANNDFDSAIERFERVKRDARASELQRQLAGIYVVRCQYYKGSPQGTIAAAQAMRAQKPESFYTRESFELEVKAHLAMRNPNGAAGAINAFAALGRKNGMQEWEKSAELMNAGLAELKSDWRAALAIHKKYSRDRDVSEEATLGELRCYTGLSDWTSLNSRSDSIIKEASSSSGKKNVSTRLLIAAHNGKGDADLNAGKPKDALLDYLQGAMVLSRGETGPEHEASLGRAAVACAKIAVAEKDPAKRATYKGRAQEMLGELLQTYGNQSRYRAPAEAAIKEVK